MNSYDRSAHLRRLPSYEEWEADRIDQAKSALSGVRSAAARESQPLTLRELALLEADFQAGPSS